MEGIDLKKSLSDDWVCRSENKKSTKITGKRGRNVRVYRVLVSIGHNSVAEQAQRATYLHLHTSCDQQKCKTLSRQDFRPGLFVKRTQAIS